MIVTSIQEYFDKFNQTIPDYSVVSYFQNVNYQGMKVEVDEVGKLISATVNYGLFYVCKETVNGVPYWELKEPQPVE